MSARTTRVRAGLAGLLSTLLIGGALGGLPAGTAWADSAPTDPANPATPTTVTADALPTVQIDGVAWAQVVSGNTVYVGGEFTSARPAGARAGTAETPRNNLLAYDIRTGELVTGFAPDLNAQVKTLAVSPDGTRLYVGGSFTKANGQARYRIAAYDLTTGALDPTFKPTFDAQVRAITVSSTTVYVGGIFSSVAKTARTRLAALDRSTGALLPWAPAADSGVQAMAMSPNGTKVIVGGSFTTLGGPVASGGQAAGGLGAIDAATGRAVSFAAGKTVKNTGVDSAVLSLSVDKDTVYASGYSWNGKGNLESVVAADPESGAVRWISGCKGDSYTVWASGTNEYVAGHPHDCATVGGWPQTTPDWTFRRGIAFSKAATGKNVGGTFSGQPAPALQNWYPTIEAGTYTGQSQGPWTVSGNSQYVVYGGEFPSVNGVGQQGLVRFAVSAIAPKAVGPTGDVTPTVTSPGVGQATVSWTAANDQDNRDLTYRVYRDGATTPVHTVTAASYFWKTATLSFADSKLTGGTHSYRVEVSDPTGNTVVSSTVPVEVAAAPPITRPYALAVVGDGAQDYWQLGETSGTTAADLTGGQDLAVNSGVAMGRGGAVTGDTNASFQFNGSSGLAATKTAVTAPTTFSVEAWFQTDSWTGGKIVGFGNAASGLSSTYDRHVYMDTSGRVVFGVDNGSAQGFMTSSRYNDGKWHHVVGTLSPAGISMYLDGKLVGSKSTVTSAKPYTGYWRIGGDRSWSGNSWFNGRIDEVAVYPTAVTADVVTSHYTLGATGKATNVAPAAGFTAAVSPLAVSVDASGSTDRDGRIASWAWAFGDGTSATGVTATHTYRTAGTYTVTLTVTDDKGATATTARTVTVTAPPPNVVPTASFTTAATDLVATLDGSASADTDGTLASWSWTFGDGTSGTGAKTTHTYPATGSYQATLTVTDDKGATGTTTRTVTVTAPPPNVVPTASFTSSVSGLAVVLDGSASADTDGTLTSRSWDLGDGATATGTTVTHTYAATGSYPVTLTVTDDDGATATTTATVSVTAPADVQPLAADAFERTVASGLGKADVGGSWTVSGGTASVADGAGHLVVAKAGGSATMNLNALQAQDIALETTLTLDQAPTGGGTYVYLNSRRSTAGSYRTVVRFLADGRVTLNVSRVVNGAETSLSTPVVVATGYVPGTLLRVRLDVAGSGTTQLAAKAWTDGTDQPADWQLRTTDATASLQVSGNVGVTEYLSGSATSAPAGLTVTDLWVGPTGTVPAPR